MPVVDTHCHAGPNWFEPEEVLLFQMERNGVDKAVLVQYRGNWGLNSYTVEAARRHRGKFCAVVLVDTAKPESPRDLQQWARAGVCGVRLLSSPGCLRRLGFQSGQAFLQPFPQTH